MDRLIEQRTVARPLHDHGDDEDGDCLGYVLFGVLAGLLLFVAAPLISYLASH